MGNNTLRDQAITLRKSGKSYKEISIELNVAKSTLSYWLKEIKLKPEDAKRLYTKQIDFLSRGSKSQKDRREQAVKIIINQAKNEIKHPIDNEIIRFLGIALYWAEGAKGKMIKIANSDPYLILFMVKWLENFFQIKPNGLKVYLNIYPQQSEIEIKKFWSDLTGIPLNNFGKSYIKPFSTGFKKNNLYFGTICIYVPKSTDLKYKMLGWLEALLQDLKFDVELTQKRWSRISNIKRPVNL